MEVAAAKMRDIVERLHELAGDLAPGIDQVPLDAITEIETLRLSLCATTSRLMLENWQLKGALGYPVPSDIPEGDFKCGLCDARRRETRDVRHR